MNVIARPLVAVTGMFVAATITYAGSLTAARIVEYGHYRIITHDQRKRRIRVGFVK